MACVYVHGFAQFLQPPVVFRLDLNLTHSLFYLIAEANATLVSLDKVGHNIQNVCP